MSIAQGFVQAMHGRLELDDTPGGGLTVTIVLPLAEVGEGR
jgi:two-component system sensor histidine kinase KdpD